jgi:hypothetical protein
MTELLFGYFFEAAFTGLDAKENNGQGRKY